MTATPVTKEEVRLLAIELGGVRKAARSIAEANGWDQQQTNRFEDRVCQWSKRYNWFPERTNSGIVSIVSSPATIVADELADNERETRLSLSRYAKRAARDAETASLRDAPYVKAAAQVAGITHKWNDTTGTSNHFTLNTLNINCLEDQNDSTPS